MKHRSSFENNLTHAAVAIVCGGMLHADPLIYEPFDDLDPSLDGNTPGLGLTGTWSAHATVDGTSLSYGTLATSGGHATAASSNFGKNRADPGTTLTSAGLMADGATLWFSALAVSLQPTVSSPNSTARTYIAIGNGTADGFDRVGDHGNGRGFEIKLNNGNVQAFGWRGNGTFGGPATAVADGTHLVVGKITWGEFGVTDDTLEVFLPGTLVTGLTASVGTIGGGSSEVVTLDGSGNATVQMALGGSQNFVRAQTAP